MTSTSHDVTSSMCRRSDVVLTMAVRSGPGWGWTSPLSSVFSPAASRARYTLSAPHPPVQFGAGACPDRTPATVRAGVCQDWTPALARVGACQDWAPVQFTARAGRSWSWCCPSPPLQVSVRA